ncbi:cytochrome c oxidase cbb3-type subunit 2 [Pseudosulfitobacter pseudonitzschiae]|uniref:Peptidase S41 n=2 Tax=Pseudosulfitobacter pseudonitzschiae TaxID=1402135 RepID=A0A073J6V0_9RHOB|nr:peptidase S41 [Pseudosulfitobacter pseudonitzschiae]QKS08952.1 cytochrome-c oxidase, cbb3-type subunit II [Pseudosulfitobacter pseudonitzschiae]SHE62226.1 cytochrome c oxidase cbb3-type subunit 2 [Pseudosulfitobacter pseudonitzschiae]
MADNEKIMDSDKDPKVSTLSDLPDEIPNELPHQTALLNRHAILEKSPTLLLIFSLLVVTIGGIVEIAPLFWLENTIEDVEGVRPYSPLELTGRDIYVREGCYLCHSQMIRPMRDEVERYGHYSLAAESMYDHPFQWGSKRTGPDVARVGGRYSDAWHVDHLTDPQSVVPESIMPSYAFLSDTRIEPMHIEALLNTHRLVGVPYDDDMIAAAAADFRAQADPDSDYDALLERYPGAAVSNFDGQPELTEMDALIAYLQVLGTMVDFSTFTPDASR